MNKGDACVCRLRMRTWLCAHCGVRADVHLSATKGWKFVRVRAMLDECVSVVRDRGARDAERFTASAVRERLSASSILWVSKGERCACVCVWKGEKRES